MKVIVIGLGSMGKRRIRLIHKMDPQTQIIGIDAKEDRRTETFRLYGIQVEGFLDDTLFMWADCAFICTSPLSHADIIEKCLMNRLHVFTEINLVCDKYESNMRLAEVYDRVLFLSSTFLYREEIQFIRKAVKDSQSTLTYSYHVGQYLPDWHPWENYTDYFVGDSRTNGCREIMAIEFPWMISAFGRICDVQVRKNRKTSLNISYNDSYVLSIEHESGIQGVILVDVVSRKAVRNLEVFGEDLYLTWDGSAQGLQCLNIPSKEMKTVNVYEYVDHQQDYADFVVENAYQNEIRVFFECVETGKAASYGFREDKEVLEIINQIEG